MSFAFQTDFISQHTNFETMQTHLFVEPQQRADNSDVRQTDSLSNQESASV